MKLIDILKNEDLGVAILYNFTIGHQTPVDMTLYDCAMPMLFNDIMREEIASHDSFEALMTACIQKDPDFKIHLLKDINHYKEASSTSLGMAMMSGALRFGLYDGKMCGEPLPTSIMEFEEAIKLGFLLQPYSMEDIYAMISDHLLNIVMLQNDSLGTDMDLSDFNALGKVTMYHNTNQEDVAMRIKNADLVVTNKNIMNEASLKDAQNLKAIFVTATGTSNVDLDYCAKHNIEVRNIKGYSTPTVAQHTLALVMHLIEKNAYYNRFVKSKDYSNSGSFSHFDNVFHDIENMTWGIVGLGNIGRKVAGIATALGCKVQYYSTSGKNSTSDYTQVDFNTILKTSDIITIHAPLNEATMNLFDAIALRKMKDGAYLVNVGRGGIINEKALSHLIKEGKFGGVGLDVYEQEPLPEDSVLLDIPEDANVIYTPHVAWASYESRSRCVEETYLNMKAYLNGEKRNNVI